MNNLRTISHIIEPQTAIEGAGVKLRCSIAPRVSNEYDPFLLFDHFAFNDPLEGPIRGFPMHPHRGIETVTYMLEGATAHRDSLGNEGLISPGDVQWMSSGRGTYRAKIGFDLQKGFNIEVHRGRFRHPGQIVLELPRAEVLSVEPLEVQKVKTSGLINWVTNKDIEIATDELNQLALDKASKLGMLEDAEKRIEQRLKEALLPKLIDRQYDQEIKFLELKSNISDNSEEETIKRLLDSEVEKVGKKVEI